MLTLLTSAHAAQRPLLTVTEIMESDAGLQKALAGIYKESMGMVKRSVEAQAPK